MPSMMYKGPVLCFVFLLTLFGVSKQTDEGFVQEVQQNYKDRLNSKLEQQVLRYNLHEVAFRAYATYFDRADVDLPGFSHFFKASEQRMREQAVNMTLYVNMRGGRIRFPSIKLKDSCKDISQSLQQLGVTKAMVTKSETVAARTNPYICNFQSLTPFKPQKKKTAASKKWSWFQYLTRQKAESAQSRENWQSGLFGLEDALAMENSVQEHIYGLIDTARTFKDPFSKHYLEDYAEVQIENIKSTADLLHRLRAYKAEEDYPLGEYLMDKELSS
ncbi:yolk ferritin [Aplysia californica]|uniref:Ferritin n=1 Tax=Aplysia californica TaxID=6500 RepID=A0ABM0JAE4_APLCA|nr:yolk ferritin [Aplysia californica]